MLVAALLFVACAPCTPFSEMTLDEPEALAPIVADFAAWTGRDGVCVPAVEVAAAVDGHADLAGVYAAPGEPIVLEAAADYRLALVHELCHALDAAEGISDDHADPGDAIDPVAYPTPELRRKEAFAQVCEHGPAAVSFEAALAARCDLALDSALAEVRAVAYPAAPPDPEVTVGPDPVGASLEGLDGGVIVGAAGRAEGAWLRMVDGGAPRVAWWSEHAAGAPDDGGAAPRDSNPAMGPAAWVTQGETAVGPDGAALWTWSAHGVAGAAVGDEAVWALTTACDLSMAPGVPAWVGESPVVFAGVVERGWFTW